VQVYQRILQQSPGLGRVLHKYGRALLENGREDEALDVLNQAIQIEDDNSHSHVCVGRIYRRQSAFVKAGYSFQRAVELDEANVEAYYWWSASLLDQEKFVDALPLIQKAVQLEPKRARNRICIARCLDALQRSGEALEHLKPFLSAATPSVDVLLTYSRICRNGKQEEQAADALKRFLKRYPRQPQVRREYGALLSQTGRLKEAEEYLTSSQLTMAS
jgi:tetratricopeptide (TPR) repeat protein